MVEPMHEGGRRFDGEIDLSRRGAEGEREAGENEAPRDLIPALAA